MSRTMTLLLLALFLLTGAAVAQEGEGGPLILDPATAPMIQPEMDDFIDDTAVEVEPGEEPGPASIGAYGEVSGEFSVISLAPRWQINDNYRIKVRVPWVLERTLNIWGEEYSASGLGDMSVDFGYQRHFDKKRQRFTFVASLKLPTGDHEKEVDGDNGTQTVPLGTGSIDGMAKATYTRNTRDIGLLGSVLYRVNSAGEVVNEWPGSVVTTRTTAGNQLVAGVFARKRLTEKLWVHLGTTLVTSGSGKQETETEDSLGNTTTVENDLDLGSTLFDLYPGISYNLGLLSPYLGARIPVTTSYDNEFLEESRDAAVVFQVSYNPGRIIGN